MPILRTITALVPVLAALVLAAGTAAGTSFGVADDAGKYADDGGSNFFFLLNDVGFTENRITVLWDPTDGNDGLIIRERGFIDRVVPIAALRGVDLIFDVYPLRAKVFAVDTQKRIDLFASYLQLLARTYPTVTKFVVGNEPNQPRFHQPQFLPARRGGFRPTAAELYERILAASYDAIKAVNPRSTVIGLGLSPRGNDDPRAKNNVSRSPVRFIHELAAAYRRSGRARPLMDELGFHPYPNSNDEPLGRGYAWPNAGLPNLGRIKQAVWDGFHGTGQAVFAESPLYGPPAAQSHSLGLTLDEYGRQATVISSVASAYHGRENVRTVPEGRQAAIYSTVARQVVCDPAVTRFLYFHLIDEADLDRFQSGLLRADGTKRPAYGAVKETIAAIRGECSGGMRAWRHAQGVIGPEVTFENDGSLTVRAEEDVSVTFAVFPAVLSRAEIRAEFERRLASGSPGRARLARAYRPTTLRTGLKGVPPGTYVQAVLLRAMMNPERAFLAVGDPAAVFG